MKIEIHNKAYQWWRRILCVSLIFAFHFSLFTLTSCSTQKAKWTNIQYHNTTCHYNVWWNGNESLKAGREKLMKSATDDYTTFLPVEKTPTADEARSVNPEMDRAIEKGVKGIKKHSIYVGGEEHVPYIKECYLLTAYATFYKQDYTSTLNTCNILVTQFNGTRAGDEAAVLMARCMAREKRYSEAEATLDQLVARLEAGNFSYNQRDKLYCAMVEATVPQEKYKKAVEYIHLATDATHSTNTKARLTFLLAQIYQKLDRRPVATKYFRKVQTYAPEYVMEFNARLCEASCADLSSLNESDIQKLERQLDAMLADKKNEEYRDQIYYAKGEMYLGLKDAQKACDNLKLSVAVSKTNKAQKGKSALKLGEVLYDIYENYDLAQYYYDTAVQCLSKDYPGYATVKRRNDMLKDLVSYTRVYERCDSLVAVAAMPESERNALIQRTIDILAAREKRAQEQALIDELRNENSGQQNTLKGDWYFYNANSVQKGKETFRQRWGMRALEDNWFLFNKPNFSLFTFDNPSSDAESDTTVADTNASNQATKQQGNQLGNPDDPHSSAYYLKDLPVTQAQYDSIDSLTSLSLLNAGYIFYDGIRNTPRALDCYLRLARDYTTHSEIEQAFYMLYRIYDRQGNTPQANYYRDMVLLGFPDGDFANLIRDNEYYKELLRREGRVEEAYAELYDHFTRRNYNRVITLSDQADELYAGHPMLPKFHYWKSLALASLGERSDAVSILEQMLSQLTEEDTLQPLALAQLELLRSDTNTLAVRQADSQREEITLRDEQRARQKSSDQAIKQSGSREDELPPEALVYRYREGQQYYVVILINDRRIKATELQYRITDFNTQYYANSGYKVNAILFSDTTQLLTIHRFRNSDEALGYYRHLLSEESPLRRYADADHTEFAISTQNYATFYNRKDPAAYLAFFKKYYLNNKQ